MNTAAQVTGKELVPRRNPRFPLAIPVDVTVLRSGVPDSVPGRSIDLGEGGLALILAGELRLGEPVGIEFRLPNLSSAVQAKAVVRHEARLRCGLEFVGLAGEQQAMICYWAAASAAKIAERKNEALPGVKSGPERRSKAVEMPHPLPRPQAFAAAIGAVAITLAMLIVLGWWHWRRAWQELESPATVKEARAQPQPGRALAGNPIRLPAEIVNQLAIHKVDPVFPPSGPPDASDLEGVVMLDAVIAADGTVADLRPISGPQALTAAAIDAVKWWRFQPYRVNGKPVSVETTLAIDFHSPGS